MKKPNPQNHVANGRVICMNREKVEKFLQKIRPKDADERIRRFQEWCKQTQPKTKKYPPKKWRFP